jgi:hypothetical protein
MSSSLHRWQALGFLLDAYLLDTGVGVGSVTDAVATVVEAGVDAEVDAEAEVCASKADNEIQHESKVGRQTYWKRSLDLRNCSQV